MELSRVSRLQTDLKLRSVGQFLYIPAEAVHKDDGKTGSQGIPASTETCCGRSLREFFSENIGGRHHIQYRAVSALARITQVSLPAIDGVGARDPLPGLAIGSALLPGMLFVAGSATRAIASRSLEYRRYLRRHLRANIRLTRVRQQATV